MYERLVTIGTFDVPHVGHAAFLMQCDAIADTVVVGVNSDAFAASFKGQPPVYNQTERMNLIRELGYDKVVLNDGPGEYIFKMWMPNVIAVGTDWLPPKDYLSQVGLDKAWLQRTGTALLFIPYTEGISTSDIRRRMTAPQW